MRRAAAEEGIAIEEGVYAGLTGPTYETPAEVRMLRTLGADAVGMSTVLEAIAARWAGLEVVGVSLVTNPGAGVTGEPLYATRKSSRRRPRQARGSSRWSAASSELLGAAPAERPAV